MVMSKTDSIKRLAWVLVGVAILLLSVGLTLSLVYIAQTGNTRPLLSHQALIPLITLSYALLGGWIISRHPKHWIGWLYIITALLYSLMALTVGNTAFQSLSPTNPLPWSGWLNWLNRWIWVLALVLPFILVLLFFPDGRLLSRRWWLLVGLTLIGLIGGMVSLALHPGPINSWYIPGSNPYGIPGTEALFEAVLNTSGALLAFAAVGALLAVGLRFRRSKGVEREQLKWVVFTTATLFVVLASITSLITLFMSEPIVKELSIILTDLYILGIAVSISIAILRHRLYDIDLTLNRTLVYGGLTLIVMGVYVVLVGGLGLLFQAQGSWPLSLLGVGIVAIAVQPVREWLQRAVNRLMYGDRDDPYAALSRLSQRLESTFAPEAILPNIVGAVAHSLKLPYVAIALAGRSDSANASETFPTVAAYGSPTPDRLQLPLAYQGETIGSLIVGVRAGEAFSPTDRRLLEDLARQVGVAAHALKLTVDLQRSREQLVTAREEERRRLRRDLHDGLGSQLAALHLRADTVRTLIPNNPSAAMAVAIELRDEIRATVTEIRRLVYELRPPALDELGLTGALRALPAQRTTVNDLLVTINAPDPLPTLPAAVEVAAYRIAQEALTNVVRHGQARTCSIRIELADTLCLDICDDGVGLPTQPQTGLGLRSMRERAEELGGTCRVEANAQGGTRVTASLPLVRNADPVSNG
jgi:two-component system NarL family sensor kinase